MTIEEVEEGNSSMFIHSVTVEKEELTLNNNN